MLTGKRFRLQIPTVATGDLAGKREAFIIPAESLIKVISGPRHGELKVDVLWAGRVVEMFAVDIEERGTEVTGKAAEA